MSTFYDDLAVHYDAIFPAEPEIVSFLAESMKGRKELLDLACGTGSYALELASRGYRVTGVDLEERMIELAKAKSSLPGVSFYQADMTGRSDHHGVFSGKFGGIYCIGNSLPHLGSIAQVKKALSLWSTAIEKGGVLVLQTVNFGRFDAEREALLPTIEREGFVFSRRYKTAVPGSVDFVTTLAFPQARREHTNSVRLLVIDCDQIDKLLRDTGFGELEYFGNYNGEAYDKQASFLMIVRARKL